MSWGAALATAAAATVTVGATTGGPPNPLPAGTQDRPAAGQGKELRTGSRAAEQRQIASSVLGRDLRFTLTAVRSRSDPLAASVRLRVLTFEDGAWRESDRALVGEEDAWFWFPLTGRHAVCEFSTAGTDPAPVAVSLLVTPSVGCSPAEEFRVENGRITSV
ncbi:hypothetical protein ACG5V6_01425 [Streptomyces chitinivorans]|uniref:Secreted protein n=1 Tax=Streptomyces chitinivorans TaxID=1257027 RepID=A0ABW7HM86_9ACTN